MKKINTRNNIPIYVDDEDFELFGHKKWAISNCGNISYAVRQDFVNGKRVMVSMHRVIMGVNDSKILVDHKDGNGLNNQRSNLRIATKSQNGANTRSTKGSTSKYLGVSIDRSKKSKPWLAQIMVDRKNKYLGCHETEELAAEVYNEAAIKYYGEFAGLNKIA